MAAAIDFIVSPDFTVYFFWSDVVPNRRYLANSFSVWNILSLAGILSSFITIFSFTYTFSIILPVSVISSWFSCKYKLYFSSSINDFTVSLTAVDKILLSNRYKYSVSLSLSSAAGIIVTL